MWSLLFIVVSSCLGVSLSWSGSDVMSGATPAWPYGLPLDNMTFMMSSSRMQVCHDFTRTPWTVYGHMSIRGGVMLRATFELTGTPEMDFRFNGTSFGFMKMDYHWRLADYLGLAPCPCPDPGQSSGDISECLSQATTPQNSSYWAYAILSGYTNANHLTVGTSACADVNFAADPAFCKMEVSLFRGLVQGSLTMVMSSGLPVSVSWVFNGTSYNSTFTMRDVLGTSWHKIVN